MNLYLKNLAKKAPGPIKRWAQYVYRHIPQTWRYGKAFRESLARLIVSEHWELKALLQYQEQRLESLLNHCYQNVPYYRRIFDERSMKPRDIQSQEDLKKLPFLTKEIVRREKAGLLAANFSSWNREPAHTSGSTGSPLDFFMDNAAISINRALAVRHLMWVGYQKGHSVALFREPFGDNHKRLQERDPIARELRLTLTSSDDRELSQITDALESFKPDFISAWPSSLNILARWMERNRTLKHTPKFLITSSENLYPHVRERIETTFRARLSDWYGQEESVVTAMQCSHAHKYHVQMELGILELLPKRDGVFEIVGTSLHNYAMPFIRYKTGDLAVKGEESCECGRNHPTIDRIIGREADLILTPERNVVSPLGLNYAFHYLDEIKEGQIIQEDPKTLLVKVVPWETLSENTLALLHKQLANQLRSSRMRFIIERVDEIPRLESGKRPFVISLLPAEEFN